jgi:predicted RNA-binding Zn ribbon-like protein
MGEPSPLADQVPYELSGGDLCLDFVNTWGDRGRPETDGLQTYGGLLIFARQTGLLSAEEAVYLKVATLSDPAGAWSVIQAARSLREALYGLCSARAHGTKATDGDLVRLNEALREALPNLCLESREATLAWGWGGDRTALTSPLWPIARAAAELLTREPPAPIRECDGAQCTWLFLDFSRGRSRRWCSMASCGNRAKARRHYHRRNRRPEDGNG